MKTACQRMAYLRKYKLVDENDNVDSKLVSIAREPHPRFGKWPGRWYEPLAPSPKLLSDYRAGKVSKVEYKERFYDETLSRLDPRQVMKDLGEDAILVCWCLPGDFCHRRLVAPWMEKPLGIVVPELDVPKKQVDLDRWRVEA